MFSGYERICAKRSWFVSNFQIWGLPNIGDIDFIAVERGGSSADVFYGTVDIGDGPQAVLFNQLTDHRGNSLPSNIDSPCVIIRPKSNDHVFIVGAETSNGFKIARDNESSTPVLVDLLIIEMGD